MQLVGGDDEKRAVMVLPGRSALRAVKAVTQMVYGSTNRSKSKKKTWDKATRERDRWEIRCAKEGKLSRCGSAGANETMERQYTGKPKKWEGAEGAGRIEGSPPQAL